MLRYLGQRLVGWIVMILVATNLTYFLASFYLDPRSNYVGRRPPVPESVVNATLSAANINDQDPILSRWWTWVQGIVLHWDWGKSPVGESVNGQIGFRIWVSAELVLGATILVTLIGVALGVYTAARQYSAADRVAEGSSIVTLNIPVVVAALAEIGRAHV